MIGNLVWGVFSDKYGRRSALLCGLIGTIGSSLLFGFSSNFWLAVFSRFLWGLLNGNLGVAKTYMSEISDGIIALNYSIFNIPLLIIDSNAARSMALFGVIGGVGRTIGPVIGGLLSSPADSFPLFRGTVFQTFPFALPCLVVSSNCLLVLFLAYFHLHETISLPVKGRKSKSSSSYRLLQSDEEESHHRKKVVGLVRRNAPRSSSDSLPQDLSLDTSADSITDSPSADLRRVCFSNIVTGNKHYSLPLYLTMYSEEHRYRLPRIQQS